MDRPSWAPDDVDLDRPTAARAYDYLLGGAHNFAADREMIRAAMSFMPDLALQAQANRAFLRRAVQYLVDVGVRQFLDIGSGIPTRGNVHEIAQRAAPDARVVYVDIDPVAVSHGRHFLAGNPHTYVLQEDVRNPTDIVKHPDVTDLLDFERPIGLLMVALLHVVPDVDDPYGIVAHLRDELSPGSHIVIGHGTHDSRPEEVSKLTAISRQTPTAMTTRTREDVVRFFDGFELVDPGVVWAPLWRPDSPEDVPEDPGRSGNYVGVGRLG